jgi:glycosyltransferase involved in cell wall biosynthesis
VILATLIFPELGPEHQTKDVGQIARYLSNKSEKFVIISQNRSNIDLGCRIDRHVIVSLGRIKSTLQTFSYILRNRKSLFVMFHLTERTVLYAILMRILNVKFYIKLDTSINGAQKTLKKIRSRWLSGLIYRFSLNGAQLITAETKDVCGMLNEIWVGKITYMPNTIEDKLLRLRSVIEGRNTGKIRIIVAGRIGAEQKRSNWIFALLDRSDDFELILCGTITPDFQRQLRERNDKRIIYLGNLTREKLLKEFSKSQILLQTSIEEGFSIAALEASMMGCLLVSTNVGGYSELTNNGEFGILIEDSGDLTKIDLKNACEKWKIEASSRIKYLDENFLFSTGAEKVLRQLFHA